MRWASSASMAVISARIGTRTGEPGKAGQCVEVGNAARMIAVRDSKDPAGPVLAFGPQGWQRFTDRVKAAG